MSSLIQIEAEEPSRSIHCPVELRGAVGRRIGVARMGRPDGVCVHFQPGEDIGLEAGQAVELRSDVAPIGPIHLPAHIISIDDAKDPQGRPVRSAALRFSDLSESQRRALNSRLAALRPLVLTVGLNGTLLESSAEFRVEGTRTDDVLQRCEREELAVLVLGPQLRPVEACGILSRILICFPGQPPINIVLNADDDVALFQEFVDQDRLFYLARGPMSAAQIHAIVAAAVRRYQRRGRGEGDALALSAATDNRVVDFLSRISQQVDLPNTGGLVVETVQTLLNASRAQCLIHNREMETLWSADAATRQERCESVTAGLVGYVARTGEQVQLERIGDDARYDADADDPGGSRDARFIAAPILGVNRELIAVVTAARDGREAPFSRDDARLLKLLAACAAPAFTMNLLQTGMQQRLREQTQQALRGSELFRQEAVDFFVGSTNQEGDLMGTLPAWLHRSHFLILLFVALGLAYLVLAKVNEVATGPVLIRARTKVTVASSAGGMVSSVVVSAGDRVRTGDLLIRLQSMPGDNLLARLKQQLRAPCNGVVSDIRVRPGQEINPGDQVASIVDEASGNEMIALLPGSYAPQIRSGMNLVLKLQGYPDSHEVIPIDTVSAEIIGPHEATRYIGKESTDAINITGPIVIARSVLQRPVFGTSERSYKYHDGMIGQAEVSVRSERMILSLIPGLRELLRSPRETLFRSE